MNYLQAKAQHNQNLWNDHQENLNKADRREETIQNTIEVTEDLYEAWKLEMQKYFCDDLFIEITKKMYDYCREEYLENPENDIYLNDWEEFVSYSINYTERKYL